MNGSPASGGVEELYPFLAGGGPVAAPALDDLIQSTEGKIDEIDRLRGVCADRYADALTDCADAIARRVAAGGRVLAFGNGGSATDAEALTTLFVRPPDGATPIPALSLSAETAVITALANDVSFDVVYSRQLATLAGHADVAIALSTSGNSANVMRALDEARRRNLLTVGFAGNDGGQMAIDGHLDHLFVVPSSSVHRIQEAQTTLYHVLWELVQRALEEMTTRQ